MCKQTNKILFHLSALLGIVTLSSVAGCGEGMLEPTASAEYASTSGQTHTDVALNFVNTAIVNDWAPDPEPCWLDWTTPPAGATRGGCFFTRVLKRARGYGNQDLISMWGSASPSSNQYFEIIDGSPYVGASAPPIETHFRQLTRANQIARGDIIAIAATNNFGGHTLIVTGPAVEITSAGIMPIYRGTKQFAVPVVDSTNQAHGCNGQYPDSRWQGECTGGYMEPGAGTAYIRIYTDSLSGTLLGHTWSIASSSLSYYSPSTRPYRIGRLYKLPEPLPPPPQ